MEDWQIWSAIGGIAYCWCMWKGEGDRVCLWFGIAIAAVMTLKIAESLLW